MLKRAGCLLLIAFPALAGAQHFGLEAGIESGPSLGKFWSNVITPDHFTTNVHHTFGVYATYHITPHIGIQTGFYQEEIGTNDIQKQAALGVGTSGNVNLIQEVNYTTIPMLFRLSFGNKFRGKFIAGGFMSCLMHHKTIWDYGSHRENFNNTMGTNRFNAGLVWGGGVEYTVLKQLNLGVEVRNQMGFVNMEMHSPMAYFRTNSLQIIFKVGYQFRWMEKKEKKEKPAKKKF
jgi:hypothetical protein